MKHILAPIDRQTRQGRLAEFERRCREQGLPCTPQRRTVLQVVLEMDCHPTADEVLAAPRVRRARISRATVYRALESLVRLGVIAQACHPGGVVRYDGRLEQHHHLVCRLCGEVVDIAHPKLDLIPVPNLEAFGFTVEDYQMQVRGVCRRCRRKPTIHLKQKEKST